MIDPDRRWLLAIDTSSESASLALSNDHRVAETTWLAGRDQTATVLSEIDRLFGVVQAPPTSLAAVAVATGPGMFNGLRVGMSIAKGFVLALDLPLIGISTLDVTAHPFAGMGMPIVALVAAGRGRLVWGTYGANRRSLASAAPPQNGTVEELLEHVRQMAPCVVTGELTSEQAEQVRSINGVALPPTSGRTRRASSLAELAWDRFRQDDLDDAVELEPVYLHSVGSR